SGVAWRSRYKVISCGISAPIASLSVAAFAEAVSIEADSRASSLRVIGRSSVGRDQLDHVESRFIMGGGKDDPPARVADPFDPARQVALRVAAILIGGVLVAQHHGPQKGTAQLVPGVDGAVLPLRTVQ